MITYNMKMQGEAQYRRKFLPKNFGDIGQFRIFYKKWAFEMTLYVEKCFNFIRSFTIYSNKVNHENA
jgi:hypothetical protein